MFLLELLGTEFTIGTSMLLLLARAHIRERDVSFCERSGFAIVVPSSIAIENRRIHELVDVSSHNRDYIGWFRDIDIAVRSEDGRERSLSSEGVALPEPWLANFVEVWGGGVRIWVDGGIGGAPAGGAVMETVDAVGAGVRVAICAESDFHVFRNVI